MLLTTGVDVYPDISSIVINFLKESHGGLILLTIIFCIIVLHPIIKSAYDVVKEQKKEKKEKAEAEKKAAEEKIKEEIEEKTRDKEFKENINNLVSHMSQTDFQISALSEQLIALNSVTAELKESVEDIGKNMEEFNSSLDDIATSSKEENRKMNENITGLQESLDSLKTTTDGIKSDMDTIFENDNDEFRVFLNELNIKHIHNKEPITREIKQKLRVRFTAYKSRGGNGWAEDIYKDLMSLPVDSKEKDDK